MAQKMVKKVSEYEKGENGIATVVKLSESQLRVDFVESGKSFPITVVLEGEGKNIPDHFKFTSMPVNKPITLKVELNKEGNKVSFISPANGEFKVKFLWFDNGERSAPSPKVKPGMNQWNHPHKPTCNVVVEIAEGKWKGCRLWATVQYLFEKTADGKVAISYTEKGIRQSEKLAGLLDGCGVDTVDMDFTENLLPEIQKQAKENGLVFKAYIEKGWVNGFYPDGADVNWGEEEETIEKQFPLASEYLVNVPEALKEEGDEK